MVNLNIFTQMFFNIFSITIKLKVTCSCIPNYIPHASEIIFYIIVLFLVLRSSTNYVSNMIQCLKAFTRYCRYLWIGPKISSSEEPLLYWSWLDTDSRNSLTIVPKMERYWLNIEIHILNSCFQNYIATKSSMKIAEMRFENAKWWLSLCYFIYTGNIFKEIYEEASPSILNGISKNEIKDEIITSGIFMADHCLP